jgi:hypothetical protein
MATPDAATMHLHGVHERPTTAPHDASGSAAATAPTIAPDLAAVGSQNSDAMPLPSPSASIDPMSPMTAFASGEAPKRTRVDTTYGKDAPVRRKARRGTPLWWLPLGAGVGVAAVVGWWFFGRAPEAGESSVRPPVVDSATPPGAAVGAAPQAAAVEDAAEPEPASEPEPEPEAEAEAEPEPEPDEDPEAAPDRTSTRESRTRSRSPRRRPPSSPPEPEPQPTPAPAPEPPRKVDNDPKSWRIDG